MNKTIAVLISGFLIFVGIVACGTIPANQQTPQQIAAQVCPAMQITIANLSTLEGLDAQAKADLVTAQPIVSAVCAAGGTVDAASLQTLSATALPALIKIADAAPLKHELHDQIVLGLTVAQITLAGVLQVETPK